MTRSAIIAALLCALSLLSCENTILGPDPKPPLPALHTSALATLLDSLRYAFDLPALGGAIITDTSVLDAQAVGCRRYAGLANVAADDQFHLGSNTKAITAVLIGVLADDGLLSWDSTLPSIFPEQAVSMRTEYRTVTIRDILSHSAGFIRDPSLVLHSATAKEQRAEVVAWALTQPPVVVRGRFFYSNLGYILAGAIAEKLTNRPYEDLIMERVLQPLGITTAGFGAMGTPGLEDQPLQHSIHYAPVIPSPTADNPPIYNPAGRLHMSVKDWGLYIRWVLAAEAGHATLVRPETARMLTAAVVPMDGEGFYALGWTVVSRQWAGGRTITHGGSNGLNYSIAWLAPNRRFGVIAMTNICAGSTNSSMDAVVSRLIDFHLKAQ